MKETEYKEEQLFGMNSQPAMCMYSITIHLDKVAEHIKNFGELYTEQILTSQFTKEKAKLYMDNAKTL